MSKYHEREVRYGAGQPMGYYSSWATFAVTHHLLLQYICKRHNIVWSDAYVIIGDDIVIASELVANDYVVLIKALGVEISMRKSVEKRKAAEIAKRLFRDGIEYTPISITLLKSFSEEQKDVVFLQLIQEMQRKWGLGVHKDSVSTYLHSPASYLYEALNKKHKQTIARFLTSPIYGVAKEPLNESQILSLYQKKDKLLRLEDPWIGFNDLKLQTCDYNMLAEELIRGVEKLFELIMILDKAPPYEGQVREVKLERSVFTIPAHPARLALDRLNSVAIQAGRGLNDGTLSRRDVVDLGMDVEYLRNLFTKGTPYKVWRDQKERRFKAELTLVNRLYDQVMSNTIEPALPDGGDLWDM